MADAAEPRPEHIKEIRSEARSLAHIHRCNRITIESRAARPRALEKVPVPEQESAGREARCGTVRGVRRNSSAARRGRAKEIEGAKLCKAAGIDCINVPDGPRASARMSAQVTCQLIQQQAEIEAVLHFCCRDRNILSIQSELLGAYTVGVRNLICITGDPPAWALNRMQQPCLTSTPSA